MEKDWFKIFSVLCKSDKQPFVKMNLINGGGGFRFLPTESTLTETGYKESSEELGFSLLKEILIPSEVSQGKIKFSNDLNSIVSLLVKYEITYIKSEHSNFANLTGPIIVI